MPSFDKTVELLIHCYFGNCFGIIEYNMPFD